VKRPRLPLGNAQPGFTLLEVLVAMTLLVVLMSMLYGGLRLSVRSWEALESHTAEAVQKRTARIWFSRLLGGLQTEPQADTADGLQRFYGNGDHIRFVAELGAAAHGGLYVVDIKTQEMASAANLITTLQRPIQVPQLAFGYWGSPTGKEVPHWHRRWQENAVRYPTLVRLASRDGASRDWPELILPISGGAMLAANSDLPETNKR
jgi:general secretion pathway protein J